MLKECFNFFLTKIKRQFEEVCKKTYHLMKCGPCENSFIVFKMGVFLRVLLHLT